MAAQPEPGALSPDAVPGDEGGETIELVDPAKEAARIGRYQLCYHLASGGMASVFLARAVGPAGFWKPVALKRIHPHLARRKDFVAMFLDEARIAARIDHPNVCAVHDFGEADGTYYLAMEYLVGVPLIRLLAAIHKDARARLDEPHWHALAARVIADAAEGLHAAHELEDERGEPLGVVHRDVSPQNVFVTFDGAVKVVDFGIALARDRVQETETGTLKGKIGYMAPEQAASGPIDRRADVWALGVCLWEMLVAARLFRKASPMETLKAVGEAAIVAPSSRRASVPAELDRIVLRALARDPAGRHASARELARELQAFVRKTGEPTGLADLSEWMEPLFAVERAQKSEIVHTVVHAPDVSTAVRAKATGTIVAGAARSGGDLAEGRVGEGTASLPAPGRPLDLAPEPTTRSRARWLAGALAIAALGGAGAWASWPSPRAPEPATTTTTIPPLADRSSVPAPVAPEPEPPAIPTPEAEPARAPRTPRSPAPRTASTIDARTGWVTVATTGGWADVYEGDRHLGQTPVRVRLRAGRHTLTIHPSGRAEGARRATVTVAPDATTPLVVPLR